MRKILLALLLLPALVNSQGVFQNGNWTTSVGQRLYRAWLPADYPSLTVSAVNVCISGAGARGNVSIYTGEGMPYTWNLGIRNEILTVYYQIGTNEFWSTPTRQLLVNHLLANFKIDINRIYVNGLSLGATAIMDLVGEGQLNAVAGVPISGAYNVSSTFMGRYANNFAPYFVHNSTDGTQGISTGGQVVDSMIARGVIYRPNTDYVWATGHGNWNERVYSVWGKWERLQMMYDKRIDSTALHFVDSAERSGLESDYWKAKYWVDNLTASAHKTSLTSRIGVVIASIRGTGARVWNLDFGTTGYTTPGGNSNKMTNAATGTTYTNLLQSDGSASTVGFTVTTQGNSSLYSTDGLYGSYFQGWHPNVYKDAWTIFGSGGRYAINGLNNAKTYTVRIFTTSHVTSSNQPGLAITLPATGGVLKSRGFNFLNTLYYIEYTNLVPTSGVINFATNGVATNGEARMNALTLIEEGASGLPNTPPVVSTGSDQALTLQAGQNPRVAALVSTATDADGTISSRLWTKVSGPSATFSAATSANTNANLTGGIGTYVFRMTATDNSGGTGFDQTTVTLADTAHPSATADDTLRLWPSTDYYMGVNLGYYPDNNFTTWTEINQGIFARKWGAKNYRSSLYYRELKGSNYTAQIARDSILQARGMQIPTYFVQTGPPALSPPGDQTETITYPGYPYASQAWNNMYDSILLSDGSVNPSNYCADYIYKTIISKGPRVKFLTVVNEIDVLFAPVHPQWLDSIPSGAFMVNWQAPWQKYVRFMRIVWEVTQAFRPDISIGPGGIGYTETLDAMGRYSDNPDSGKITPQYPKPCLAYFNIVDFHLYPMYKATIYDPTKPFNRRYMINSDRQADEITVYKNDFQTVLNKFGYNGVTKPRKQFALTEFNVSRLPWSQDIGSLPRLNFNEQYQSNVIMKAYVKMWKDSLVTLNTYLVLEQAEESAYPNGTAEGPQYFFMGLAQNGRRPGTGPDSVTVLQQGYTFKTIDSLLGDFRYDAARTASMNLNDSIRGAAFKRKDGTEYRYMVWASTYKNDSSEVASQTYTLPSGFNMPNVYKYDWSFSKPGGTGRTKISSSGMSLTGMPLILGEAPVQVEEPLFLGARDRGATFELKIHPLNKSLLTNGTAVVVGSSTAAGTGASTYLNSMVPKLQAKWASLLFYNIAVGGQTGTDAQPSPNGVLSRNANTAASADPTFVLLAYPNNHVASSISIDTFTNWMLTQFRYYRNLGIPVFVTGAQPRTGFTTGQQNTLIAGNVLLNSKIPPAYMNDFGRALVDSTFPGGKPFNQKPALNAGDDIHYNDSGVVIIANNHFHDIDSIFFDRSTIYSAYDIQYGVGVNPTTWLPFDYITDCSITRKSYSRLGAGTYSFRMRARKIEDDSWTAYSDTAVLSQPYQRNTISRVIKVNLGLTADTDAPAPWNEVSTASGATTSGLTWNLVDSAAGAAAGVFTVTRAFSTVGQLGIAGTGYPLTTMTNGWQNSATAGTDVAEFTITGLTPGAYQFEGVGSKNNASNYNRILGVEVNGSFGGAPIHIGTAASVVPVIVYSVVGADSTMRVRVQSVGDLTQLTAFTIRRYDNIINATQPFIRFTRRRIVKWGRP